MEEFCRINNPIHNNITIDEKELNEKCTLPITLLKTQKLNSEIKIYTSSDNVTNDIYYINLKRNPENSLIFCNYFPNTYNFLNEIENIFINELNNYEKTNSQNFNIYQSQELSNLDDNKFLSKFDKIIKKVVCENLPTIEEEIKTNNFIEEWNKLDFYFEGKTKIHIILTLVFLCKEFATNQSCVDLLSNKDKDTVFWALLLHDIAKHVKIDPNSEENFQNNKKCKDKIHPFKSGAVALKILQKLNFLNEDSFTNELVENTYMLLLNSNELVFHKSGNKIFIHSFSKMKEIKHNLTLIKNNSQFVYDVVVLIIFHQSLPNCEAHMNNPLLSEEDIKFFFDERLIELMRILMVNDSAAHSLFSGGSLTVEINENIDIIRKKLYEFK